MILLINENNKENFALQKALLSHFPILTTSVECFEIDYVTSAYPQAIVLVYRILNKSVREILLAISSKHSGIPIFCPVSNSHLFSQESPNIVFVPQHDYKILIKRIKEFVFKAPDWNQLIEEIQIYINNNLKNIYRTKQVIDRFNVSQRKLQAEFKLKTGHSIKSYIIKVRIDLIKNKLCNTSDIGNYYSVARDCGLTDDRSLYILLKRKFNKTTVEFHKELLNFQISNARSFDKL